MSDLNYQHLYYFWTVAGERGFVKASKKLELSQSAVSLQIQALEKQLGKKLINRTTRKFELTPEGLIAKRYCDDIFARGSGLLRELDSGAQTSASIFKVGCEWDFPTSFIQKILQPRGQEPWDSFKIESGSVADLIPQLLDRKLDVVCSNTRPSQTPDRKLMIRELQSSKFVAIESCKRPRLQKGSRGALEKRPLFVASVSILQDPTVKRWIMKGRVDFQIFECGTQSRVRDLTIATAGALAILPFGFIQNEIENVKLKHELRDLQWKLYLTLRNGSKLPLPL